ncbi:MAG: glycosyltransferase family 2 protein [Oscillospiraceae bacterium]|nr:glycosyltransferase family 2 protein [Oscillospiraceae bacterium]
MEDIKVIILVAAYNNGEYVGELLHSLTTQTHRNIEIYIRDDGSVDNTMDIVRQMKKKDPRIQILESQNTHVTPPGAMRNFFTLLQGVVMTEADYLMFCDADDVWMDDKIEQTLSVMLATEGEYTKVTPILVHTDLTVVDAKLNMISSSLFRYERLSPNRKTLKNITVQNNVTGCTVMINHSLRDMVNAIPREAIMHDWWLAMIAAAFGAIVPISQSTILYRQHGGNQIGAYKSSSLLEGYRKLTNRVRMKEIYRSMYRQAGCFADSFRALLRESDLAMLQGYARMEQLSKIKRITGTIRGRYYKNTLMRNIGQFLIILFE